MTKTVVFVIFFNIYLYFCAEKLIALTKHKLTLLQPKNYLNYGI